MSIIEVMKQHRSIRSYRPDSVPEAVLEECLDAGIRASSAGNMQTYSIIVTGDRALREELHRAHFEQDMVLEAPLVLTFCADFYRMRRWLSQNDAPDNFDNFMSFMVAAIDAVLVAQNVALAAEAHGLGICYMGTTLANCERIGRILRVPESVVPVTAFTLGYPDEDPPLRDRLPRDGLVHRETYEAYTNRRIAEIYHDRETKGWARYMGFPELRRRIEESGVKNLAQVYTVVKYTRESHIDMSQRLLDFLARQDFMKQ
jgi:nitroreductase